MRDAGCLVVVPELAGEIGEVGSRRNEGRR